MKYFNDCQTLDDAKSLYRQLCKQLHPDKNLQDPNYSDEEFKRMQSQFVFASETLKFKSGKDANFNFDKFDQLVQKFQHLNDVNIDIMGSENWVYIFDEVKGATYRQKEDIKAIEIKDYDKAKFCGRLKKWLIKPTESKAGSYKGSKSYDDIKALQGCTSFKTKKGKYLAA
jgi:curved DNA-binding protein CbpA